MKNCSSSPLDVSRICVKNEKPAGDSDFVAETEGGAELPLAEVADFGEVGEDEAGGEAQMQLKTVEEGVVGAEAVVEAEREVQHELLTQLVVEPLLQPLGVRYFVVEHKKAGAIGPEVFCLAVFVVLQSSLVKADAELRTQADEKGCLLFHRAHEQNRAIDSELLAVEVEGVGLVACGIYEQLGAALVGGQRVKTKAAFFAVQFLEDASGVVVDANAVEGLPAAALARL